MQIYDTYEDFNVENINTFFNEDNFQIIKDSDGLSYLIVLSNGNINDFMYIFNDDGVLLTEGLFPNNYMNYDAFIVTSGYNDPCELENNALSWYEDVWGISENNYYSKNIYVKIEDNQIYYLAPIILNNSSDMNRGYLEERVYSIHNDELLYEVINTYPILNVCQEM